VLDLVARWPGTAAVATTIVVLSHVPPQDLPPVPMFPYADKLIHAVEYLVLGVFLFRSLAHEFAGNPRLAAIITLAAGAAFGLLDEWHQAAVGRTADARDLAADAVGLLVGLGAVLLVRTWRRPHGD
jgi:VanZ family protein